MKIELKSIKVNLAFSEETTMFKADIFVNGVKAGYANNDGRGGCTNYQPYENKRDLLNQADAYLKTLPSTPHDCGLRIIEIDSNLENFIDNEIDKYVNKKEQDKFNKKLEKDCLTNIAFGPSDRTSYRIFGYGKSFTDLEKYPNYESLMVKLVAGIKGAMKEGDVIFNTNIDLKKFGL
jgi:hypothetical protein